MSESTTSPPWFPEDPINRIGYKNGVIIGLLIAAAGSALSYRATALRSYPPFLMALFIVGLGLAMLQIPANPCHNPRTGTQRVQTVEFVASL